MNIGQVIQEYKQAQAKVLELYKLLEETSDGFKYLVRFSIWGSESWREYKNSYVALEETQEFNGDNGFADVYTDNPELASKDLGHGVTITVMPEVTVDKLEELFQVTNR